MQALERSLHRTANAKLGMAASEEIASAAHWAPSLLQPRPLHAAAAHNSLTVRRQRGRDSAIPGPTQGSARLPAGHGDAAIWEGGVRARDPALPPPITWRPGKQASSLGHRPCSPDPGAGLRTESSSPAHSRPPVSSTMSRVRDEASRGRAISKPRCSCSPRATSGFGTQAHHGRPGGGNRRRSPLILPVIHQSVSMAPNLPQRGPTSRRSRVLLLVP